MQDVLPASLVSYLHIQQAPEMYKEDDMHEAGLKILQIDTFMRNSSYLDY